MSAPVSSKSPIYEIVAQAHRATSLQTLTDAILTTIIFNAEDVDLRGEYNPATGVFTAADSATYLFSWSILTTTATWTAGDIITHILSYNGSTDTSSVDNPRGQYLYVQNNITSQPLLVIGSAPINLAAGDTGEIKCKITRGADTGIYYNASATQLRVVRMGRT